LGFATITGPEAAPDTPTGNSLVEPEDIPALGEGHKDRSCVPMECDHNCDHVGHIIGASAWNP
jgi:hypothetical protein